MTETEKALFHVALGAAIFIIGYHLGLKRGGAQQQAGAALPMSGSDWLALGGWVR